MTGILLDVQSPAALWVSLAEGRDKAVERDHVWFHVKYLPRAVEFVDYPSWAIAFELKDPADLAQDFLNAKPRKLNGRLRNARR